MVLKLIWSSFSGYQTQLTNKTPNNKHSLPKASQPREHQCCAPTQLYKMMKLHHVIPLSLGGGGI